jgi:hypothetical protein
VSPPNDRPGGPGSSRQDINQTSASEPVPSPGRPLAGREYGWHLLAVSTGSLTPPIVLGALHPVAGEAFAGAELVALLTITGTALFGSRVLSERAFRLLRWLGNPSKDRRRPDSAGGVRFAIGTIGLLR